MTDIVPFCTDGIDCLTLEEKLSILCAPNPINAILEEVNCKKENHHNILLTDLKAETIHVFMGGRMIQIPTDQALYLLSEVKILDLHNIVNQLENFLRKSYVKKMREYLNGGCNDEPHFRKKPCDITEILKKDMTIKKIKKQMNK